MSTEGENLHPIGRVVDAYRACPEVKPTEKDGGIIAALVGRYGPEAILGVIRQKEFHLGASDNPLMFLAGSVQAAAKRGELRTPVPKVETPEDPMDAEQRRENIRRLNKMSTDLASDKAMP